MDLGILLWIAPHQINPLIFDADILGGDFNDAPLTSKHMVFTIKKV